MSTIEHRRRVYICGPFRAPNAWEVEQNIRRAEELALSAWRAGFAVFCPHTNTRFFNGAAPDEIFLKGDLEWLLMTHVVLLVPGWERSSGSCAEVKLALDLDIPVYVSLDGLISGLNALTREEFDAVRSLLGMA